MSVYKKLFKQTLIYGIAAVIPKMIGFIMAPLHMQWLPDNAYGNYTLIFSWMMFFNVILAFGMETAFFRFYNKRENKKEVINNSIWYLFLVSFVFLGIAFLFKNEIDHYFEIQPVVTTFLLWILVLDTLVVIPFAILRAHQRPVKYSAIRIMNVAVNALLTIFFLYLLPIIIKETGSEFFKAMYRPHFEVGYVFLSNLIASIFTLIVLSKYYLKLRFHFNIQLWKDMLTYGFPVMIAGLAFVVNETFDKVFLKELLPEETAVFDVARYGACYKLGVFMVLFRMAYTLGIEPFFFSYAKNDDAPTKYATITKYFVLCGSLMMLVIIVFADFIKQFYITNENFWSAMEIVPYIILANLMLGIYTNLSVWYKLQDKTKIGAYISVAGAVVTVLFNFILIPYLGILGSAITTLIAYAFMMTVSYMLGQKSYPIPYDKKSIGLYLGSSVLFSYVYFYNFRENYIVGIAFLLLFIALIAYKEQKLIQRILK